ncbi:MAG: hypothetical protein FRX48_04797 [Lasallia pustulata]|uniref:Uncharacterized protein n=1 Tax=Lasallia pustulata TaxID=136370 RepID=A0A5M8PRA2_9LECA|nr:MAG: hypothetical protein FRX48_04797 [Lasallia pustulata]
MPFWKRNKDAPANTGDSIFYSFDDDVSDAIRNIHYKGFTDPRAIAKQLQDLNLEPPKKAAIKASIAELGCGVEAGKE